MAPFAASLRVFLEVDLFFVKFSFLLKLILIGRFLESPDFQPNIAKRFIDQKFVLQVLDVDFYLIFSLC